MDQNRMSASAQEAAASPNKRKRPVFEHWHMVALCLVVYDLAVAGGAYFAALWLRFDCRISMIPRDYLEAWFRFLPIYLPASIVVSWFTHLYQSIWRFASFNELKRVAFASGILGVFHTVFITILFRRMPISYYVFGIAIQFVLMLCIRFAYRFVLLERGRRDKQQKVAASRVMLIGAGAAGQMILRDLHSSKDSKDVVCCIIDDNSNKWGRYIDGVPVVGGREDILLNVEK